MDGPISAEVVSLESGGMVEEARELAKIHPNIVIKIPITPEGLKATHILRHDNIKVNMTLIFSTNQALLAARAGAAFVSPFVGRLDDVSHDGMHLIEEMVAVFKIIIFPQKSLPPVSGTPSMFLKLPWRVPILPPFPLKY